ncbi:hypothetical protein C5E45_25465 [Nocardia nova]|uniref:Uncharacterized protein n=1 Tax=Nocardia nova TaxID=37330 RepID=A0A2S6AJL5_9NOCA|nr:hypothetical protein C5E41_19520 [Nocardia nova]PPJ35429.1 hypothetical protein C5E45_25465 [Nocardia nova]
MNANELIEVPDEFGRRQADEGGLVDRRQAGDRVFVVGSSDSRRSSGPRCVVGEGGAHQNGVALGQWGTCQGEALCALAEHALDDTELDTLVPPLLLSAGAVLVDELVPLRDLIAGLADVELPGHTTQLLALLPDTARPKSQRDRDPNAFADSSHDIRRRR